MVNIKFIRNQQLIGQILTGGYYYNEETKKIEFIDKNIKVKDGYAEFVINHCSEYFLTGAVVNDAVNNPKSLNYVIVGLVGLVIALVGYTLFKRR